MKNIILLNKQPEILSNATSRLMIEDERELNIVSALDSTSGLLSAINNFNPDEVVVADNLVNDELDWNLSVPVVAYAGSNEGLSLILNKGLKNYGIKKSISDLLDAIENNEFYGGNNNMDNFTNLGNGNDNGMNMANSTMMNQMNMDMQMNTERINQSYNETNMDVPPMPVPNPYYGQQMYSQPIPPYQPMPQMSQVPQPTQTPVPTPVPQPQSAQVNEFGYPNGFMLQQGATPMYPYPQGMPQQAYPQQPYPQQPYPQNVPQGAQQGMIPNYPYQSMPQQMPQQAVSQLETMNQNAMNAVGMAGVQADLNLNQSNNRADVITVFSAKGGVGKTTISSSLAILLSNADKGKAKAKVCLVDYDTEFGDIFTTLKLDGAKSTMMDWYTDITARIASLIGKREFNSSEERMEEIERIASTICYTKEEIYRYLQDYDNMKVLVAPLKCSDSTKFNGFEYEVMLRNLRDFGDFDYIVCDTSNSIKDDCTYTAIDMADKIYLINTQDVSTVNCNDSFRIAMMDTKFDMSKFRIIINIVRAPQAVGIKTEEIENIFSSYPCVAKIDEDVAIIKSANKSEPLVKNINCAFAQEIKNIVTDVMGLETVKISQPKKKGLFRK